MSLRFSIKKISHFALLLGICIGLSSCSTRKNTFPNRAYHTVTAKFNIIFNGKEALKVGETDLRKRTNDNYTAILPIYYYPSKEDAMSIFPAMDRTIEKASKAIYKHSMFIKGKEWVKPIDNAYLIMGKAYFHKQDYIQAQRVFSYIVNTHKNGDCIDEATIWLARSSLRLKHYARAKTTLDEAQYTIHAKKSKKLNVLYSAATAEYQLTAPDGEPQIAIDLINEVIANNPKRDFKTRMYFILGQLHESLEQFPDAQKNFLTVLKRNPIYVMEFNARMHLATSYDGNQANKQKILKELNKMLVDIKNVDYKDQIYYAISEIARIDDEQEDQIENLALSVTSYVNNNYQRTLSALKLADLYFEKNAYVQAQAYYDTASLSMPKDYPNYNAIVRKTAILTDLVTNLQTIVVQDSLQRIAKMSQPERQAWVNKQIANEIERERKAAEEEANREAALQSSAGMATLNINTADNSGKWYFYNPALVTSGKTDFIRKWGSRKLEDNWRVSSKQQITFDDLAATNAPTPENNPDEEDEEGETVPQRCDNPKEAAYYTQDLPLTAAAMDSSNMKIANASYQGALIYLDQLNDPKKGCEMLEKLVTRFPDHELALPSLYLLYLNYNKMKNPKSEEFKNTILTKYPNTDYAKLIENPNYYVELEKKEKELEIKYEETYQVFLSKNWKQTVVLADAAIPLCKNETLRSKYAYIRAVAKGQTEGRDSLKSELLKIVHDFPKTGVDTLARIFLSTFEDLSQNNMPGSTPGKNNTTAIPDDSSPFTYLPNEQHFLVFIANVHQTNITELKNNISAFNREFYSLQHFDISSFYTDQNNQMVTVAKFKNKATAMEYYNNITKYQKFASDIQAGKIAPYVISATNYTTYYNLPAKRNMYDTFFKENYLK